MKQKITLLIVCIAWVTSTQAQHKVYTLEECRALALVHNTRMKTSHLAIESAEQGRKQALTAYFPTIDMIGTAFQADKGTAELTLAPDKKLSMMKNGVTAGVTALLPVFAGGRIANGSKMARLEEEMARYKLRQSSEEVSLTVEHYYWQLVNFRSRLTTVELMEELTSTVYREVKQAVDAGVKNRNELLQVQLRRDRIAANRLQVENSMQTSRMLLAQYIGVLADSLEVVQPTFSSLLAPESIYTSHEEALPGTTTSQLLNKQVEMAKLQKKLVLGGYLPSVSVGGGYLYHNLLDTNHSFGILMATVSVPLSGWWGGSHELKKQQLNVRSVEYNRDDTCERLLIRMQQLYNDLNETYKLVKIAEKSIETAMENVRLSQNEYQAGTSTLSEWLDAQALLQDSYDQLTDSYTTYLIQQMEYLQATGR